LEEKKGPPSRGKGSKELTELKDFKKARRGVDRVPPLWGEKKKQRKRLKKRKGIAGGEGHR